MLQVMEWDIWFHYNITTLVLLWQYSFPASIWGSLVTAVNHKGIINNSELELMGAVSHQEILAHTIDISESSHALINDNMATIHWLWWGSIISTSASTYLL